MRGPKIHANVNLSMLHTQSSFAQSLDPLNMQDAQNALKITLPFLIYADSMKSEKCLFELHLRGKLLRLCFAKAAHPQFIPSCFGQATHSAHVDGKVIVSSLYYQNHQVKSICSIFCCEVIDDRMQTLLCWEA